MILFKHRLVTILDSYKTLSSFLQAEIIALEEDSRPIRFKISFSIESRRIKGITRKSSCEG